METSSNSQAKLEPVESATRVSTKERLKLIFKFALVGVVFFYMYQKGIVTGDSFHRLVSSPKTLSLCLLFMVLNTVLGAMRWQVLLDAQGAYLPLTRVLELNMVGSFFNIALPGAVSGDFIKAVYVAKQFKEKRAAVFGSMLFDRILGVTAMVIVASFSALISEFLSWGGKIPPMLSLSVGAVGFGCLFFFAYMFLSHKRDPFLELIQLFTRRNEKLGAIDRLYLGVMNYRAHPRRVFRAIPLSILIHFFVICMAFFISDTICATPISFLALAVIVPIGLLATAIPILPAGVGTGHIAFYALFKMIGSDQGAEVFSLIVLYQIIFGLIGGLFYVKLSAEK